MEENQSNSQQIEDILHEEKDASFMLDVGRTKDKKLLLLIANSKTTTEVKIIPSNEPMKKPQILYERKENVQYFVEHKNNFLYLIFSSSLNETANYSIKKAPLSDPQDLQLIRQVDDSCSIEDGDLIGDNIITYERKNSLPYIKIQNLDTQESKDIHLGNLF